MGNTEKGHGEHHHYHQGLGHPGNEEALRDHAAVFQKLALEAMLETHRASREAHLTHQRHI